VEGGAGAFIRLWRSEDHTRTLSLRPDIRARWLDVGASGNGVEYVGTLGLSYAFGGTAAPAPMPVAAPPIVARPVPTPPPAVIAPAPAPVQQSVVLEGVKFDFDKSTSTYQIAVQHRCRVTW
jgi:hypothetical protein